MRLEPLEARSSQRVRLNIGGRRFETTVGTLTGSGAERTYFTSVLQHAHSMDEEIFIDRDGDSFAPLLSYLRTGQLIVPSDVSDAAVRLEADFYCIALPSSQPERCVGIRLDGMYLSFGAARTCKSASLAEGLAEEDSASKEGDVRAYLLFGEAASGSAGSATLGRREADGQWSALRCRYVYHPGGLLQVQRADVGEAEGSSEDDLELLEENPIELSAVVINGTRAERDPNPRASRAAPERGGGRCPGPWARCTPCRALGVSVAPPRPRAGSSRCSSAGGSGGSRIRFTLSSRSHPAPARRSPLRRRSRRPAAPGRGAWCSRSSRRAWSA